MADIRRSVGTSARERSPRVAEQPLRQARRGGSTSERRNRGVDATLEASFDSVSDAQVFNNERHHRLEAMAFDPKRRDQLVVVPAFVWLSVIGA